MRCSSLLAFAVFVNLVLTLTSIGFMVYKVRVLEEQLFQLQTNSSVTSQTETMDNDGGDLTHQRLKRSESLGGVANGKCETLRDGETVIFLYETETFSIFKVRDRVF